MAKRKSISKKIRFEVFKRDKFICQYCGRQSPNVILEIDHIEPVSKGGTNDILNLITSCKDCNRGKTNVRLDDESALAKQKKQLELLQERREQIELLLEWRKSLSDIESDTVNLVADYINSKLQGYSLSDGGKRNIEQLTKKFKLSDILEATDISVSKYLRYDTHNDLIEDSVENFISKIGGIVVLKAKPPIEKEVAYIKGICRNRFNYWNNTTGSIILNNYLSALRESGWDDDQILEDLENEVKPKTIECKNWTEWKNLIEEWTEQIKNWEQSSDDGSNLYEIEDLKDIARELYRTKKNVIPALQHIGSVFDDYTQERLEEKLSASLKHYLITASESEDSEGSEDSIAPSIMHSFWKSGLGNVFKPVHDDLTFYLNDAAIAVYREWLGNHEIIESEELTPEYAVIILKEFDKIQNQDRIE